MGALIRAHDWSGSLLGSPHTWPASLKAATGILLNSGYPMYVAWGGEFIQLYNDAYRPILGSTKHPAALGAGSAQTFAEIWDYIGPMFRSVMQTGEACTFVDQLLPLNRHGYTEECYFVFSYSPVIDEAGKAGGVFVTVLETSERVLRERRQRVLRDLTAIPAHGSASEILRSAIDVLRSDPEDIPLVRARIAQELGGYTLVCSDAPSDSQAGLLFETFSAQFVARDGPIELDASGVFSPWPEPVSRMVRVPIPAAAHLGIDLLVGLSPRLSWDEAYGQFLSAVARNIGVLLSEAAAFEVERRRSVALAEIDAAKTAFFSNVSHEFRTPLTLMLSPLQELLEKPHQEIIGASRELVSVAYRNALRLLKLVNALLDFSRIEAGRVRARYQATDLALFTQELASNFRSATDAAGLDLIVDCQPHACPAFVDHDMWEKIVLNLLSNAFKFTLQGKIFLRLEEIDGSVELTVQDTGVGIPNHELPRLFERFYRVEGVSGRTLEGTGIGLALVEELVVLHGGKIWAVSEVGQGSTFKVRLPLGRDHLPAEQVETEELGAASRGWAQAYVEEAVRWLPDSGKPKVLPDKTVSDADDLCVADQLAGTRRTILLADDNSDVRSYVSRLLSSRGYEVVAVGDGEAALAATETRVPDLILTDVMMPKLDGFGLLRKLRENETTQHVPTILLSARAGEEAKIEGLAAGADDYLVKPFSARELFARIESAIKLADFRARSAEAMRDETMRVRRLFEMAPGFIAILRGPDHVFEFTNAAYRRLVGERQLTGRPVRMALPEVEGQGFFELLDSVYSTGERFVGEQVPVRLQGAADAPERESFVDFIYEPIIEADGQVTGIFVEGHDVTQRRSAESALRESQARLELATEAAELGIWDWNVITGRMTYSARAKAICGFPSDLEVTYHDAKKVTHPEDYPRTAAMAERALNPILREQEPYEYRLVLPDGEVRWVIACGEAVFEPINGVVRAVRYVGTLQDITERKRAVDALALSDESLRLATEAAEIGTWDLNLQTNELKWSNRTKAAFGISRDMPCSMVDFYSGLHPDDRDAIARAFAHATDPDLRAEYDVEYRTIGKEDGLVRWVAAKGKGLFDASGKCIRAIGTLIDISNRKAIERELRSLNERLEHLVVERTGQRNLLETIVATTDAFIQVLDLNFQILAINRSCVNEFERVFGVRPTVGDNIVDLLAHLPEHQAAVKALWSRALAGEEFTVVEDFGDPSRARPYYEIKFNTLRDETGQKVGAYQFVYDVTERLRDQARLVETQDALRQSQKLEAIGQLTGGVAHDFNNLLTPIIGGLDMLQRKADLDQRTRRIVDGASNAADRARTLVQRLLAFSRRQPLQPTAVDVAALVRGMVDLVGSTIGPQIQLVINAPAALPAARGDLNQLEMAVLNLAVNARDAMPNGGILRLSADAAQISTGHSSGLQAGAYVRISVSDTGVGMNEETMRRAVEPFFSTKGIGRGTGLGLSMVHGLAAQLGGALVLRSRIGAGTDIDLWLPQSGDAVAPAEEAVASDHQALLNATVLLVDDEEEVRESTARMLEELGYEIILASSAEEALRHLEADRHFDVLVTDHLMAGMTGVDLARHVRLRRPGTPILVISGYAEAEGLAPDLHRLTKPFRQADLIAGLDLAFGE